MSIQKLPLSKTADAAGAATMTFRVPSSMTFVIHQVSVQMAAAPIGAACQLNVNDFFVTYLIPTGDAAAGDPPIPLDPTDEMTLVWSGLTPGQIAQALILYDDGV